MNNLPLFIALRYLFSKKNSIFTSVITKSSIIGIALGITVVITVLSVMNGFHNELRNKILGMVSHVIISNVSGEVSDWENVVEKIKKHKETLKNMPIVSDFVEIDNEKKISNDAYLVVLAFALKDFIF